MSDSLRDKIAAVLANHLPDDYVAGKCDCGEKTDDGHSTHQADAVIRELEADVMADDYVPPCCRPGGRCNRE